MNLKTFQLALEEFAHYFQINEKNRVLLIIDGAGFHQSTNLNLPEGLHLLYLPPYSPELQPVENLWPMTNEAIANRHFETLDELEEVQTKHLQVLSKQPNKLRDKCLFHWWPC